MFSVRIVMYIMEVLQLIHKKKTLLLKPDNKLDISKGSFGFFLKKK